MADERGAFEKIDVEAKSPDQILELAKEQGIELSDEQMEQITGGVEGSWSPWKATCPKCRTEHYVGYSEDYVICNVCGYKIDWPKIGG